MGFGRFLCLVLLVWFSCSLSSTHGRKFQVGGKEGWVSNPSKNYTLWAQKIRFQVNDSLYFKYKKGSDSVLVVNKDDYNNCNTKNPIQKLDGGDSEFKFDRSGPFFFISGQNGTCEKGQKLIVIVLASKHSSPPHAQPPSPPPASGPSPSGPLGPSPSTSTPPTTSPVPSPSTSTPPTSSSPVPSPSTSTPPTSSSPVPSPSTSSPPTSSSPVPSPSTSTAPTSSSPVPSPSTSTPPTSSPPSPTSPSPEGPTPSGATSPPPGSENSTSTAPEPSGNASHAVTPSSLLVSWVVVLVSLALMSSSFGPVATSFK